MKARPARIGGWVGITYGKDTSGNPVLGGLMDISRTGARLYLTWKCRIGERVPLAVRAQDKLIELPSRVVWVRKDEPGDMDSFEARLSLLKDFIKRDLPSDGMPYGYVAGVRFEQGADLQVIRMIQRHLEKKKEKPGRGPKPVQLSTRRHTPAESAGPATGWYRPRKKYRVFPGMSRRRATK